MNDEKNNQTSSNTSAGTFSKKPVLNVDRSSGGRDESEKSDTSQSSAKSAGKEQSEISLPQIMEFFKDNWRELATELVATGVTTYLAFSAKEKSSSKR